MVNIKDVQKDFGGEDLVQINGKVPLSYKEFIQKNKISPAKLLMRSIEELMEQAK